MIGNERGQATRRLVRLFESATSDELQYGLSWYEDAHEEITRLADEHGLTTDQVAGVVAALSPQTAWPQNLARARQLLSTGDTYGFRLGRGRAQRIVAGEDPDKVLGGPKVRAFYDNLRDPINSTAVTVDRHAYDAAAGMVTNDRERHALDRKGEYERIADLYRSAAAHLGVAPHVAQAVVWAAWRNRFGLYHFQRTDERNRLP